MTAPFHSLSRREFLKLCSAACAGLVYHPFANIIPQTGQDAVGIGRVTTELIYIYDRPSFDGQRIGHLHRDQIVSLLEELNATHGPFYNPVWYRLDNGYVHSGYIQRVDQWHFNQPLQAIPPGNILGVVTVPYVRAYLRNSANAFEKVYRLYYNSTFWITGIVTDSSGTLFYRLLDDWLKVNYYVSAVALQPLTLDEYAPFKSSANRDDKRILVDLSQQTLTAYDKDQVVLHTKVATGRARAGDAKDKPTTTPVGSFRVRNKVPSRHMGNGALTDSLYAYELPGVPWTMFFHKDGYALHGAYWHDNFGIQMSHGCVNMKYEDAKWLFRWTSPEFGVGADYKPGQTYTMGEGTLVQIIEGG